MIISVIGTGYLGATHAACLAELGFEVIGVDADPAKIELLGQGLLPFSEPGLDDLLAEHVASGRLRFTTSLEEAARVADVHFVCVGTPQAADSGAADLGALFNVVRGLAGHCTRNALVVGKSTVPVGTAKALRLVLDAVSAPGVRLGLAWNPEFLREGHAVQDTLAPDRLVFGVDDVEAEWVLREVYDAVIARGCRVHVTDLPTAELSKAAANAFLATKISFVNAIADISDAAGADILALADVLGDDPRIGRRFLDAGIGFGGGCLPKDIRALATRAADLGASSATRLLREVDEINLRARRRPTQVAVELLGPRLKGRRVAVLGAAFKPLSDDVRDSPALAVAEDLHARGADVRVFDPEASVNARIVSPGLTYVANVGAALADADLVLHLTEWPEFQQIDPVWARGLARTPYLVDGRNKLNHDRWRAAGWTVVGVGRGDRPQRVEATSVPTPVPVAARVPVADVTSGTPEPELATRAGAMVRRLPTPRRRQRDGAPRS